MSEPLCGNGCNGKYCRAETVYNEGGYDCPGCGARFITLDSITRYINEHKDLKDLFEQRLQRCMKVTAADMRTVVEL